MMLWLRAAFDCVETGAVVFAAICLDSSDSTAVAVAIFLNFLCRYLPSACSHRCSTGSARGTFFSTLAVDGFEVGSSLLDKDVGGGGGEGAAALLFLAGLLGDGGESEEEEAEAVEEEESCMFLLLTLLFPFFPALAPPPLAFLPLLLPVAEDSAA